MEPQRARSRGRQEKQEVCGSISALFAHRFAVPAPPLRAIFRITDIFYGPHPLAGGRSDALLHPCLLSSLDWDPLPERQGNVQTLEIDVKDPPSVAPKGQSPDQSLKQLEQMEGDILCCSHWNLVPLSISMASIFTSGSWNIATLPKTLSQWKLKVLFPHVRILKEIATMKIFIFELSLMNSISFLPVLKQLQLVFPQALKTEMKIMIFQKQVWKAEENVFSSIKIF